MSKKSLLIDQLDRKMISFSKLQKVAVPPTGWIKALRMALGISAQQLGKKLSMTRQGVHDLEQREKTGSITLRTLKETAKAMDMQVVYGFIPNDGSLTKLIERKAMKLATEIVLRTSNTMKLEDQENTNTRIKKAIQEKATDFKNELPKILWD